LLLLLQHNSSATCGDTDGDGAAGPTFAVCGLGTEYVSSSVNITIDGITDADAAVKCCTVSYTQHLSGADARMSAFRA
jgi:hypothetical protein